MPPTILLVEDEPGVRQVTREALELGGYRVRAADGPLSESEIARDETKQIDLLLTDVMMPGMNGPELAQRVREYRPQLVTLVMTGYADKGASYGRAVRATYSEAIHGERIAFARGGCIGTALDKESEFYRLRGNPSFQSPSSAEASEPAWMHGSGSGGRPSGDGECP